MDKKTQIINAAVEVFAKQGLEKGKIADIAKVAGIGKGTIYEYFKSKDGIFNAIEEMFIFQSIDQINLIANSVKSPKSKIEEIINYSLDMHNEMGSAAPIIAELWAQQSRGHPHGHNESIFAEMYLNFNKVVENVLKDGVNAGDFRNMNVEGVATLLLAFIDGVIWQSVIFKDDKNFQKRINDAAKSFMKGILKC